MASIILFQGSSKTVGIPGSTENFTLRMTVDNGNNGSIADQTWQSTHLVSAELTSGTYTLRWPPATWQDFILQTDMDGKVIRAALPSLNGGADNFAASAPNGGHINAVSNNSFIRDTQMRENAHSDITNLSLRGEDPNHTGWSVAAPAPPQVAPPAGSEEFSFNGNNFKEFDLSNDVYTELTIELWAKRGAREVGIMLLHSGTNNRQYPGVWVNGDLQWVAGGGPRYPNGVNANYQLPRDTWVHLAFVKNAPANQMIVYVNGVEKANVQGGYDRAAHDAPTGIGILRLGHSLPTLKNGWSESWMAKHGFEGQMAEVRIWKTVRTPQEILAGMQVSTAQLPSKVGLLRYGPVAGNLVQPPARPAIFFSSMEAKKIQRLSADGALTDVIQCAELPRGVAVDRAGGKIYWSESWAHRIKRANLDGSGEEVIHENTSNVYASPLDLVNGKAYFGEGAGLSDAKIYVMSVDGSNKTLLFDTPALPHRDLMDLEVAGDKLYWINGQEIEQCNLDGSGRAVLVAGLEAPRGLEIDRAASKVYWTEGNKIRRAGLDGSGVETIHTLTVSGGLEHLDLVD
jgi:hypothetical protein